MFNKHFVKRLFYFVLIVALGAAIALVANFLQSRQNMGQPVQVEAFDS